MAGDMPRLSLIVPAFQEADGLAASLRTIREAARSTELSFQLIVVDDGSTDGTWAALQTLAGEIAELIAIRLSRNFGKEAAICAGLDRAVGEACIVIDADLQHPPRLIPEMVQRWQSEGWDVVEAVKLSRGREPKWQRWMTRGFYRSAAWLTGDNLQDASDFKLLDRRVVDEWRRFGERATFFRGLVAWLGFRRTQVFFEVAPRQAGRSRWSMGTLSALAVRAVTSFSALPLQMVSLLGVATLLLAAVLGAQAIRLWVEGEALPGFTTVILLQLIIGGFLMVSLGIIGTYLARIYDEVKARPRYIVREALTARTAERAPALGRAAEIDEGRL
ncbi:MAG: glycosyltransferase family 2 protein [Acidobacteria bacterium]|nr:glycosyltransferase family 2 protein [Acidobacteriota bacterium]